MAAPATARESQFPYPCRARHTSSIQFLCPECGYIGTYRITHGAYRFICANPLCRQDWLVGLRFLKAAQSPGQTPTKDPMDLALPPQSLVGERWHSAEPIHSAEL